MYSSTRSRRRQIPSIIPRIRSIRRPSIHPRRGRSRRPRIPVVRGPIRRTITRSRPLSWRIIPLNPSRSTTKWRRPPTRLIEPTASPAPRWRCRSRTRWVITHRHGRSARRVVPTTAVRRVLACTFERWSDIVERTVRAASSWRTRAAWTDTTDEGRVVVWTCVAGTLEISWWIRTVVYRGVSISQTRAQWTGRINRAHWGTGKRCSPFRFTSIPPGTPGRWCIAVIPFSLRLSIIGSP